MAEWKIRDRALPLGRRSYVMGIVNVTPDSFSDGGRYLAPVDALAQAERLEAEGVDILDFGGQSTRPGHTEIPPEEEWDRLRPVLEAVCGKTSLPVSVDTYFPFVAERALALGVQIINDVSGVVNPDMAALVRESGCGWVLIHAAPIPPEADVVQAVSDWFSTAVEAAVTLGVQREQLCLDPGIGFGKDDNGQNFTLIRATDRLKRPGLPYLLGVSRKRCIGGATGAAAPDRDFGSAAAHTVGIFLGADIIRAHCGAGSVQAARVADALRQAGTPGL